MSTRRVISTAVVIGSLALAGCWESADVTVHKQGEYKGPMDPLANQGSAREQKLQERFKLIQARM